MKGQRQPNIAKSPSQVNPQLVMNGLYELAVSGEQTKAKTIIITYGRLRPQLPPSILLPLAAVALVGLPSYGKVPAHLDG